MRLIDGFGDVGHELSGELIDVTPGCIGEKAARVQIRVLHVIISLAVHLVVAGLGLDQDHGAESAPKLRREIIRQDLHFLDGADIHALPVLVFRAVVVGHTVGHKSSAAGARPVERDRAAAGQREVVLSRDRVGLEAGKQRR